MTDCPAIDRSHPVDRHVGRRIRLRRTLLGLSQETLAGQLGVSFQQVQKYEKGSNRVSASRLYRFAEALDVVIGYFFDDMPGERPASFGSDDLMCRRETLELVRAYYRMPAANRGPFRSLINAVGRAALNEASSS